jgi:branched-chain amino acid transport system substrate-binding protein
VTRLERTATLLLAMLLSTLAACGDGGPRSDATQVVVQPGDTIKIGVASDLSNISAESGADIANAADIAVRDLNEAGGVRGFRVQLVVEDDRCRPSDAEAVASGFAADPQVVAVVGHLCSDASLTAAEIYANARIPMVSPASTGPNLTARGLDVVSRVAWNDVAQGQADAHYAYNSLGARTVAVLYDDSADGLGLARVFADTFEKLGGQVVTFQAIQPDRQDYRSTLQEIADLAPGLLFYAGDDGPATRLVVQTREVGPSGIIFFGGHGTYTPNFADGAGTTGEGVYASFNSPSRGIAEELNAEFDAKYEDLFGSRPEELGPFHAHAYDATLIILNAIQQVAQVERGRLVIEREALIAAIRATEDFEGLTGTLTCDSKGECGAGQIGIYQIQDGEWVFLGPAQ